MFLKDETDLLRDICTDKRGINLETLERVIFLAVEIAREGRERRKIGTMFVVSDAEETLKRSECLILDPLWHHPEDQKRLDNPNMRQTLKELAQLDGAFIVSDAGIALSACRYINASSEGIHLPLGLGSRHMAASSITKETNAIAVVPAALLALLQSPTKALYVILLYLVIQAVESYLLIPLVQRQAVSLPPALTITAQVLLGILVGGFGLVLATPLTAAVMVLIRMLYIEDALGDSVEMPSDRSTSSDSVSESVEYVTAKLDR